MPISSGNSAATSSSSWLRRRKKVTRSSLAKNLRVFRTGAADSPAARPPSPRSPSLPDGVSTAQSLDIEALPGEADEQVLKAWRLDREAAHADAGVHELGGDLLRRHVAELRRDQAVGDHRVGEAELRQDLGGGRGVAGAHRDPGGGGAAQRGELALEDELAEAHHAHVRGYLLHLGEQVRGDEDRDPVGRDLADERADLAGALRVEAVGRLVQDDQVAGREQGGRDRQALLHAE